MVLQEFRENFGDLYHSDGEVDVTHDTIEERLVNVVLKLSACFKPTDINLDFIASTETG